MYAKALHGVVQLTPSGSKAATGNAYTTPGPVKAGMYREAIFFLYAASGTGTLDVTIMTYDVNSQQWFDLIAFTQLTGAGQGIKQVNYGLGQLISVRWVIGTGPFTFQVNGVLKD